MKHIDSKFIGKFVDEVRKGSKKGSLFAVGEFWKDSPESLDKYLNSLGTQVSRKRRTLTRFSRQVVVQRVRHPAALQIQGGR